MQCKICGKRKIQKMGPHIRMAHGRNPNQRRAAKPADAPSANGKVEIEALIQMIEEKVEKRIRAEVRQDILHELEAEILRQRE